MCAKLISLECSYSRVKMKTRLIDLYSQFTSLNKVQKWQTSLTLWWTTFGTDSTQVKLEWADLVQSSKEVDDQFMTSLLLVHLPRKWDSYLMAWAELWGQQFVLLIQGLSQDQSWKTEQLFNLTNGMMPLNNTVRLNKASVERIDTSVSKIFLNSTSLLTAPSLSSQETPFKLLLEWNGLWMNSLPTVELHPSLIGLLAHLESMLLKSRSWVSMKDLLLSITRLNQRKAKLLKNLRQPRTKHSLLELLILELLS